MVFTPFVVKHLVHPFWIVVLLKPFVEVNGMSAFWKLYKKTIIQIEDRMRTYKFGSRNKLKSLNRVNLPWVIAGTEVSIITDVVESDIPLLLSKDAMKRARICLDFESDCVTMLRKKFPERVLHLVTIIKPPPNSKV